MKKYLPKSLSILFYLLPQLAAKIALNIFATPTRIPRPISEMKAYEASKKFFLKNNIAASRGLKTKSLVLVASPAFYDRVVEFFSNSLGLKAKSKIH